jgi:oligoribonuclease
MEKRPLRLVWVDLEMTGLDPDTCVIVEIAAVITGPDLVPIAEVERVVWQPDEALARMDPFVRDMHQRSGLYERIRASKTGLAAAERDVMALVTQHCTFREAVLAGNSIHQDRRFLSRYMPVFEGFLHYRQVDVSSLKVLSQAWYGDQKAFRKDGKTHTALDDIRGSLDELRHYRQHLFVPA